MKALTRLLCCVFLVLMLMLSACNRTPAYVPFEGRDYGRFPGNARSGEPEYQLGFGDELEITVLNHEEFSGEVKVDKQGNVLVPLLMEEMRAEGLSIPAFRQAYADYIRPYVVQQPRLKVELKSPGSQFVYIHGEVRQPGKYAIGNERLYLRELVERAGWPTEDAALYRTRLVRSDPDRDAITKVRLDKLMLNGDLRQNYELQAGDIVVVPETYFTSVSRYMRQAIAPFAILLGADISTERLGYAPRLIRNREANDWYYEGEAGR